MGEQPSGRGARTPMDLAQLPLASYRPRSRLQNRQTHVPAAYFASIDAHGHLGRWLTRGRWAIEDVTDLLSVMDACNIAAIVNLDGRWGDELTANLERYDCAYPGRFLPSVMLTGQFCRIQRRARKLLSTVSSSLFGPAPVA